MRYFISMLCALLPLIWHAPVLSQTYPSKPVRIATGFPPGGPTDLIARVLAEELQLRWGQPIVVESRPGASGTIAMQQLKEAQPDGQFLIVAPSNTLAVTPHMLPTAGYDPLTDFSHIWHIASIDNVLLVSASIPVKSLDELVAHARSNPKEMTFGSPSHGSQAHLSGEFLNTHYGLSMTHVPYKGTSPALTDLLGGHIQLLFTPVTQALPQMSTGKVRAIALPARERNVSLPDVPTFSELGLKNFEASTWFMLIGPSGLDDHVVKAIREAMAEVTRKPEVRKKIAEFGAEVSKMPPEEVSTFLNAEVDRWGKVVRSAGLRAD